MWEIYGVECKSFQKKRKCETDAKSIRVYLEEEEEDNCNYALCTVLYSFRIGTARASYHRMIYPK